MVQLRGLVFNGVCCDVIGMGCGSDLQDLWFWESYALCVRVSINLWRHTSNLQDLRFWES